MVAILKKELNQFFSSITGYISILVFLVAVALFLFIFPDSSLLNDGYATLDRFFQITPWIFLLLIPAITMRTLADEWRNGTMELLATKPLGAGRLILGKYLACLVLLLFALLPTVTYYFTIRSLAVVPGDVDNGAILGSYIGLFLLGSVFTAIGIWASSITGHSVAAFLVAVFTCFIFYTGFDALSRIPSLQGGADYYLQLFGINFHYTAISRGVIDLRDIVYFFSVIVLFLMLSRLALLNRKLKM